jgi:hypothetical protein
MGAYEHGDRAGDAGRRQGAAMKKFDWKELDYKDSDGDRPFLPTLSGFFYLSADVHEVAEELAAGLDRYVQLVGLNTLKSYAARDGDWKPMTKRILNKSLKHLRDFPRSHIAVKIEYDAGEGGEPGPFGVYIHANETKPGFPGLMSVVRVDFPARWLYAHDIEEFLAFVSEVAEMPHVQSANAGFTFKSTSGSKRDARFKVDAKLPRYLGFGPDGFGLRYHMLGRTWSAHWLNYVDDELAASLGGRDAIVAALSTCEVRKLQKGVLIRGAKLPPIGDIKRKAPDLGCLPDVARLLKPTRFKVEDTFFATANDQFDAAKWIERLDDLEARPWDNRDAI